MIFILPGIVVGAAGLVDKIVRSAVVDGARVISGLGMDSSKQTSSSSPPIFGFFIAALVDKGLIGQIGDLVFVDIVICYAQHAWELTGWLQGYLHAARCIAEGVDDQLTCVIARLVNLEPKHAVGDPLFRYRGDAQRKRLVASGEIDVDAGLVEITVLGDAGHVEHAVDPSVAAEVESMLHRSLVALAGGRCEGAGA